MRDLYPPVQGDPQQMGDPVGKTPLEETPPKGKIPSASPGEKLPRRDPALGGPLRGFLSTLTPVCVTSRLPDLQVLPAPVQSQARQGQAGPNHFQQRAAGPAGAGVCPAAVPGGAGALPARLLPAPHRGAGEPQQLQRQSPGLARSLSPARQPRGADCRVSIERVVELRHSVTV